MASISLFTDERKEQTRHILKCLGDGYASSAAISGAGRGAEVHRAVQRMIVRKEVLVPYAQRLAELMPDDREGMPGFDRLQRALALAEKAAFVPEGLLKWLNRIRLRGKPKVTEVPLTADGQAAAIEEIFRKRVQWWGG